MDMDTVNINTKEEFLTDNESLQFDQETTMLTHNTTRKIFTAERYTDTLDEDLLCNVAEHILEMNKVMKPSDKKCETK